MLCLASAAFAAKGAVGGEVSPQGRSPDETRTDQGDRKLVRIGSNFSAGSDDGYATAAEGSTSRPASTESLEKIKVERVSDYPNPSDGNQVTSSVKPNLFTAIEKKKFNAIPAITPVPGRKKMSSTLPSRFAALAENQKLKKADTVVSG